MEYKCGTLFRKFSFNANLIALVGCNAGGIYTCINGGVCISTTGTCVCVDGFSGPTCYTVNNSTGINEGSYIEF